MMGEGEFYLEFLNIGGQVKVMAIDPETGIEVSIVAPQTASQSEMTNIAVAKLKRRIAQDAGREQADSASRAGKNDGRGILV